MHSELAQRIWRRYTGSMLPGAAMGAARLVQRIGQFHTNRLPLLAAVQRRWWPAGAAISGSQPRPYIGMFAFPQRPPGAELPPPPAAPTRAPEPMRRQFDATQPAALHAPDATGTAPTTSATQPPLPVARPSGPATAASHEIAARIDAPSTARGFGPSAAADISASAGELGRAIIQRHLSTGSGRTVQRTPATPALPAWAPRSDQPLAGSAQKLPVAVGLDSGPGTPPAVTPAPPPAGRVPTDKVALLAPTTPPGTPPRSPPSADTPILRQPARPAIGGAGNLGHVIVQRHLSTGGSQRMQRTPTVPPAPFPASYPAVRSGQDSIAPAARLVSPLPSVQPFATDRAAITAAPNSGSLGAGGVQRYTGSEPEPPAVLPARPLTNPTPAWRETAGAGRADMPVAPTAVIPPVNMAVPNPGAGSGPAPPLQRSPAAGTRSAMPLASSRPSATIQSNPAPPGTPGSGGGPPASGASAVTATPPVPTTGTAEGASEIDMQRLANQVYALLLQRLALERERRGL